VRRTSTFGGAVGELLLNPLRKDDDVVTDRGGLGLNT
jgi:hypothetical protein